MEIKLKPTGSFEVFRGVQYRLYVGETDRGQKLQMLGMFRIPNPMERAAFSAQLVATDAAQGVAVTEALDGPTLITGAEGVPLSPLERLRRTLNSRLDELRTMLGQADEAEGRVIVGRIHECEGTLAALSLST